MEMQLSDISVDGLKLLNNQIPVELGRKLIINAIKQIISKEPNLPPKPELYINSPDLSKHAEYSISSFYVLGVKFNYTAERLREFLLKQNISETIANELIDPYDGIQERLRENCKIYGYSLPHIKDVNWTLVCSARETPELSYKINFGAYSLLTGDRETVADFNCNVEELQTLINRLKEIERHCEKITK